MSVKYTGIRKLPSGKWEVIYEGCQKGVWTRKYNARLSLRRAKRTKGKSN